MYYLLIFIVFAGSAGAYVVIINIADFPPPERLAFKLWTVMAASALLGGVGAWALFRDFITAPDPMPGRALVGAAGAIALGMIVGAGAALILGLHVKPQARQ
jgi:hypothetical protein